MGDETVHKIFIGAGELINLSADGFNKNFNCRFSAPFVFLTKNVGAINHC